MGHLPDILRPSNSPHREFVPGIHLPAGFLADLKALDPHLYLVWHPWRIIYDDVMNQYTGSLENPRFAIREWMGEEIWGWALTDPEGNPVRENRWHIWRLCWPHGWCHVSNVAANHSDYLTLLMDRLYKQSTYSNPREMREALEAEREEQADVDQRGQAEMFDAVQKENRWLMQKAMDNFEWGRTAPTRPTKDIITSYRGQGSKSKITREITDEEGGLIIH